MSRASQDLLAELHSMTAQKLLEILERDEVSAAELSVITKFLKDNGIEALPEANKDLSDLQDMLPKFTDEDILHE